MVFSLDIRRIKQESYRIIRQDGLSDICGGLMLGFMAIFFLDFQYAGALIVGCAMQTIILPTCRRKITYPRVGYVKFPGRAEIKGLIVWDIVLPLAVIGLVICVGIWARGKAPACPLSGNIPGDTCAAWRSYYILISTFLASGIISQLFVWRGSPPETAIAFQFWCLSGILIAVGLVQLRRFLHKYPKTRQEVFDGQTGN